MRYLALLIAVLVVPAASAQTTRYVDPSGTDSGDCADPADPCRTVAYALAQAVDGDALQLAAGIYTEDGGLFIDKDVTIEGAGAGTTFVQEATTAASADARIVTIPTSTEVSIHDLTLRHSVAEWVPPPDLPGPYAYGGGAIRNDSRLTLIRVTVTDNSRAGIPGSPFVPQNADAVFSGGGIMNRGILYMEECLIQRNEVWESSGDGGGIYNAPGAQLTLVMSSIRENTASSGGASPGRGGGLYNAGTATVIASEISENRAGYGVFVQATGDGGGVYNTGTLELDQVVIWGNATRSDESPTLTAYSIGDGGGLYNAEAGTVVLREAEVTGNRTGDGGPTDPGWCGDSGDGGGVYNAGTLVAEHSLIENNQTGDGAQCDDNTRGGNGGGLYVDGPTTISNSTIRQNRTGRGGGLGPLSGDGAGIYVDESGRLDLIGSTVSENETADHPFVIGGYGAGVFVHGAMVMRNSTVSGNLSESNSNGGGTVVVIGFDASLDLIASTITENRSATVGGLWVLAGAESVRVRGSIIANNVGSDCVDNHPTTLGVLSFGHNLIGDVGFCEGAFPPGLPNTNGDYVGTDDAPLDPVLGPLADNGGPTLTHALLPDSPAIGHGVCTDLDGEPLLRDQRGYTRVPPCDIGAFERDALPTGAAPTAGVPGTHVLTAAYPNPFNPRTAFTLTLAEAEAVTVTLVDALGREVARLHDGPLAARTVHRFEVDGARLASGVYVVVVQGERFRDHLQLTLVR